MANRLSREELRVLLAGLALVALIVVADAVLGPQVVLVGFLIVPVFLMSAVASVAVTAIMAGLTVPLAALLGLTNATEGTVYVGRVAGVALSGLLAIWIAHVRTRRERQHRASDRRLAAAQVNVGVGRRLRVALDAGRMGTWVWNAESGSVAWDAQLEALFGLAPGEYDGSFESWTAMLHPQDRDAVLEEVAAAVGEGRSYVVEHRCVWPDGSVHWLEGRGEVVRDEDGNVTGTTGVTVDVTERKLMEAEAEATRQLTVEVLELEDMFGPDLSPEQVFQIASRDAVRLFGAESAALWRVEGGRAQLAARQPPWATPRPPTLRFRDLTSVQPELASLRPGWLGPTQLDALPPTTHAVLTELVPEASLWVPTPAAGRAGTLLTLAWGSSVDPPTPDRVQVVERFAAQVALALAQAQRAVARDEAHQLTARLQSGLVPSIRWTYSGFDSAALYRPGEDRLLLGGDFYDMLPHGDGAVTFVLGDVSGHGPEAAALGATLRAAWSGLARVDADPRTILTTLHQVVLSRRSTDETFATAIVGTINAQERRARYALAGHPPPIVLAPTARSAPAITGPPLGILDEPGDWPVRHLALPDPGALLLFTDGLIEGRAAPAVSERYGIERLLALLNRKDRPWDLDQGGLYDVLVEVTAANGGPLADDIAVLFVRPQSQARAGAGAGAGGIKVQKEERGSRPR